MAEFSPVSDARVPQTMAEAQANLSLLCGRHGLARGRVFRHYKGGLYTVTALSVDEATLEPLVTYLSDEQGTEYTRKLANFVEPVSRGGENPTGQRQRFVRLLS